MSFISKFVPVVSLVKGDNVVVNDVIQTVKTVLKPYAGSDSQTVYVKFVRADLGDIQRYHVDEAVEVGDWEVDPQEERYAEMELKYNTQ